MKIHAIGVDIGGTNTETGIVDIEGNCLCKSNIPTSEYPTAKGYIDALSNAISSLMYKVRISDIQGIGVGAPNGNYYTGCIEGAVNLNFKEKIPLKGELQKRLKLPVVVTNDANAAAYGEMIYGGAKKMKNFVMITLGTGVGSGIVVNGQLVYGQDGNAGELGHIIIDPNGRDCNCGRKGCLEKYVSSGGIKKNFEELYKLKNSNQDLIDTLTSKNISDMALNNDPVAIETFEITGKILGLALANAATFTSPEAFFLMGGPVKAGNLLLKPLIKSFNDNLLFIYKNNIKICESQLPENNAAILGAAALTYNAKLI